MRERHHPHHRDEQKSRPPHRREDPGGGRPPHGHGHHGRRGGRGGDGPDRMERGSLRYVLLDVLRDGPRHGYDLIKTLEERTQGQYAPSPGTVYPTLQLLDDLGHIRARQEGDRRVYEITDSGLAELAAQAERVTVFWSRFASPPSESGQKEIDFLKEELDHLSRTVWGGLRDAIHRDDRETVRAVRRAVERCRGEVRDLIADAPSQNPSEGAA